MSFLQILLTPPVTLLFLVLFGVGISFAANNLAPLGNNSERKQDSYMGGLRGVDYHISPNYSQFYPYAFFFALMHVVVLVIATVPRGVITQPLLYVGAAVLALLIIFRR